MRLRQPVGVKDGARRAKLIQRAIAMRREIKIDLNTVAYWNEHVREPHEAPIDPDPHGEYAAMLTHLNELIAANVE